MESLSKGKLVKHLAGIVPVAGQSLDFNLPWPDAMMPIAPNYLAVEKAVYECASAGCETIWVICFAGTIPLLRKTLGDYITDPASVSSFKPFRERRDINIYYVSIPPRDRFKRDSLGWSILYGADIAYRTSMFLSKWIAPEKFFCSFPYGITDDSVYRKARKLIADSSKNTIFKFKNKSIKEGIPINFTFNSEDYKICRDIIKKRKFDEWYINGELSKDNLKTNESKFYSLEQIFSGLNIENCNTIEVDWHYDISSWENYKKFISSEHSSKIKKNNILFLKTKRKIFASENEVRNVGTINLEYEKNSIRNYDDEQTETETNS